MEVRQCRFCLLSKDNPRNRLISPCACRGSIAFVHIQCLEHWRHVDLQRNGWSCGLCGTQYRLFYLAPLEDLPDGASLIIFFLQYPIFLAVLFHYIWVFHEAALHPPFILINPDLYFAYQYLYQATYGFFFWKHFNVKQKSIYFKLTLQNPAVYIFLFCHIYLLLGLHNGWYLCGPLLDLFMGVYWKQHCSTLHRMNRRGINQI